MLPEGKSLKRFLVQASRTFFGPATIQRRLACLAIPHSDRTPSIVSSVARENGQKLYNPGMILEIDWQGIFVPAVPVLETFIRGSLLYLALFLLIRLTLRRVGGTFDLADILMVALNWNIFTIHVLNATTI